VKAILQGLADAVQAAVRAYAGDPGEVTGMGADGTPTQRIDLVAEQTAFQFLKSRDLPYTVVSEEAGRVEGPGEWTLVLDPVDGTHNAVRGLPAYSVSVAACPTAPSGAVERLAAMEAGLVRDLVTGHTYYAERGKGATLDGRRIRARRPLARDDTVFDVYLGTNAHPDAVRVASRGRRVRNLGAASLDLCLVATGAADMYYMHSAVQESKLRAVDIAAGTLIVREAGGHVLDLDGNELDLPLRADARTDLVAVGDRKVLEVIR